MRYDGVYRIEKCWLKVGVQVCIQLNNHNFSPAMSVQRVDYFPDLFFCFL